MHRWLFRRHFIHLTMSCNKCNIQKGKVTAKCSECLFDFHLAYCLPSIVETYNKVSDKRNWLNLWKWFLWCDRDYVSVSSCALIPSSSWASFKCLKRYVVTLLSCLSVSSNLLRVSRSHIYYVCNIFTCYYKFRDVFKCLSYSTYLQSCFITYYTCFVILLLVAAVSVFKWQKGSKIISLGTSKENCWS